MLEGSRDLPFRDPFKETISVTRWKDSTTPARATSSSAQTPAISTTCIISGPNACKSPAVHPDVFGLLGGIGPHPDDVMHMKRTADGLSAKL